MLNGDTWYLCGSHWFLFYVSSSTTWTSKDKVLVEVWWTRACCITFFLLSFTMRMIIELSFIHFLRFDPVSIKVQFHSNCICAFYWPLISHSSQNFDRLKVKICKLARRLCQSRFFFLVTCCSYEFLSYLTVWLLTYGTPLQ